MASISDKVALKRLEDKGLKGFKKHIPIRNQSLCKRCGRDRVFLFTNKDKMIISPADSRLPAIIGECNFVEGETIPEVLEDWLECYTLEIAALQDGIAKAPSAPPEGRQTIAPLLGCTWGQIDPFYNNLPMLRGKRCQLGCSATALGQVLYYWGVQGVNGVKHRVGCTRIPKYTSNEGKSNALAIEALSPIAMFDYDNLPPKWTSSSKKQKAAAQLCEYVAKAIKSDFDPNGTGSSLDLVRYALKEYFRFTHGEYLDYKGANTPFIQAVYDSLVAKSPVIMRGTDSGKKRGHCFVCDGYRASDNMFHFNFGYEGDWDGWYAMNLIKYIKYTYEDGTQEWRDWSWSKGYITNIKPLLLGDVNEDGKVNVSDIMKVVNEIVAGRTIVGAKTNPADPRCDVNFDGVVDEKDLDAITKIILNK